MQRRSCKTTFLGEVALATSAVAGAEWLCNLRGCRAGIAMQPRGLTERTCYATSELAGAELLCNFGGCRLAQQGALPNAWRVTINPPSPTTEVCRKTTNFNMYYTYGLRTVMCIKVKLGHGACSEPTRSTRNTQWNFNGVTSQRVTTR